MVTPLLLQEFGGLADIALTKDEVQALETHTQQLHGAFEASTHFSRPSFSLAASSAC